MINPTGKLRPSAARLKLKSGPMGYCSKMTSPAYPQCRPAPAGASCRHRGNGDPGRLSVVCRPHQQHCQGSDQRYGNDLKKQDKASCYPNQNSIMTKGHKTASGYRSGSRKAVSSRFQDAAPGIEKIWQGGQSGMKNGIDPLFQVDRIGRKALANRHHSS
jgi:hypothetical protein